MALASYLRLFLVAWLSENVISKLRATVFHNLLHQDLSFFETTRKGDLLSRLMTDTTLLQTIFGTSLPLALRNGMIFLGGTIMLFWTNFKLTALVFIGVPFILIPIGLLSHRVRSTARKAQDASGKTTHIAEESLHSIKTIQAFCAETSMSHLFKEHLNQGVQASLMQVRERARLTVIIMILVFGAISALLWKGGYDLIQGRMTGGELSSFIFYAIIVAGSLNALSEVMGDLQRANGAADRILDLLKLSSPNPSFEMKPFTLGALRFSAVNFTYPARPATPVLKNISFTVQPGEMLAFVGLSGAGKSTIFNLILRFYEPTSGKIIWGNQDLPCLSLQELRSQIAYVPQDPVIFTGTLYENIVFGNREASYEDVLKAADLARISAFASLLPQGYDTPLGEKGHQLSAGERQRIAIARALLKDAPLLLLDEATSALDSENEAYIQQALESLMQNRTTLVIAHRLSTVQKADQILVINEGEIIERGSHHDLKKNKGLYEKLVSLQLT
jgi:ATP-binding cassette subfamily B protein